MPRNDTAVPSTSLAPQSSASKKYVYTETIKTSPGYDIDAMKETRLTPSAVPYCKMNYSYDYNQIGLLACDNTFATRVSDIVKGKTDSQTAVILEKLMSSSGYITDDIKPLGIREENGVKIATPYSPETYFWSKGAN